MFAYRKKIGTFKEVRTNISWIDEPFATDIKGLFYKAVSIDTEIINGNDYVFIESAEPNVPLQIVQVTYMWENKLGIKMFHARWLWRGNETVLGETSNSRELFLVDDCQDVPLSFVKKKTSVEYRQAPEDWSLMGKKLIFVHLNFDEYYFS